MKIGKFSLFFSITKFLSIAVCSAWALMNGIESTLHRPNIVRTLKLQIWTSMVMTESIQFKSNKFYSIPFNRFDLCAWRIYLVCSGGSSTKFSKALWLEFILQLAKFCVLFGTFKASVNSCTVISKDIQRCVVFKAITFCYTTYELMPSVAALKALTHNILPYI